MRGRDDPGEDRDAGDTNDELAGEAAKLSAMRSVWLTMRDEEPSSGGLAGLMAAARGQAAEMAAVPRWWQRVADGLRRPPALAFATVLVLLGGAMIVGRQLERDGAWVAAGPAPDAVHSQPEVPGGTAQPAAGDPRAAGPRGPEATRAQPSFAPAAGRAAASRAPSSVSPPPASSRVSPPPASSRSAADGPSRIAPSPGASSPTAGAASSPTAGAASRVEAPRPTARSQAHDERAGDGVSPAAGPTTAPAAAVAPPPGDAEASLLLLLPAATSDRDKPERADHRGTGRPGQQRSGETTLMLYQRCDAAATRGDCAEARRLVDQISTTDRGYRGRITRTSQIGKCLAE